MSLWTKVVVILNTQSDLKLKSPKFDDQLYLVGSKEQYYT